MGGYELNSSDLGYGPVAGYCEHVNNLRIPQTPENFMSS
jgi:hypothetical protein